MRADQALDDLSKLVIERHDPGSLLGRVWQLREGHVARANPIWQMLVSGAGVLAIFSGANQYITPLFGGQPMLSRIVSVEIAVTRVVGKFKSSQHRPENERLAVVAAPAAENVSASDRGEVIPPPKPERHHDP